LLAQNSSRKIRPELGPLAAKVGTAVEWREDLAAALVEAKDKGRPVFWYVPTLRGSPMDRKPEIDRYMMAGPFSWPSTVALLNASYIPVRMAASGEAQATYGLTRGKFIEPGYLVLDSEGNELARLDQVTTWHPEWFDQPLHKLAGVPMGRQGNQALAGAWAALGGPVDAIDEMLQGVTDVDGEDLFIKGAARWMRGDDAAARLFWQQVEQDVPDHPWAWKAAAEREGHGPLVRGFEVHGALPPAVLAGARAEGSRAPEAAYSERELWERSVAFLLTMQRSNGGFEDSRYDFGGTDSLPNVYVATSAIAGRALLAALRRGVMAERVRSALAALYPYVTQDQFLNTEDRDEILWAYAYRTRFLVDYLRVDDGDAVQAELQRAVDALQALQPSNGAWFHEYPNPFAIGTALCALKAAEGAGAKVDGQVVDRGVLALLQCRTEEGAYSYGYSRRAPRAPVEGAAGRMPRCELALAQWDRAPADDALERAVEAAARHHDLLAAVRKYDDHADRLGYGGFFFWYDMLGRTEAMLAIRAKPLRERLVDQQRERLLALPEIDGAFVDSHELGRVYGTAMALWCLDLTAPGR